MDHVFKLKDHILELLDYNDVQHVKANIKECKKMLQAMQNSPFTTFLQ